MANASMTATSESGCVRWGEWPAPQMVRVGMPACSATPAAVRRSQSGLVSPVVIRIGTGICESAATSSVAQPGSSRRSMNVWAFPIADGTLGEKKLLKKFDDHGFDGMRCDVDGNLYVTRYGKGTVVVLSPAGAVVREVDVLGKSPSNLCFGGPDGRTVYVTEVEKQRLVQFRVDKPGLAWKRWQEK